MSIFDRLKRTAPVSGNAVFVHDDKILLTFNFEDGTRTITLSDIEAAANESGSDLEMFGAPIRKSRTRTHLDATV